MEGLLEVELADDVGEWVSDGVLLCELINKLHPGTISTINIPPPGQVSLSTNHHISSLLIPFSRKYHASSRPSIFLPLLMRARDSRFLRKR